MLPAGLYTKRGWYYYQPPMRDGYRPKAVALRTRDLSAALQAHRDLLAAGGTVNIGPPVSVLHAAFLEDCQRTGRHRSPLTTKLHRYIFAKFLRTAGDIPASTVTADHIHAFNHAPDLSPSTAFIHWRNLSTFFTWCVARGHLPTNPCDHAKLRDPDATRAHRFVSREIRDNMIAYATHNHLRLFCVLGFHCGLRRNEIIEARPDWLSFSADGASGTITVQRTPTFKPKTDRPRVVPLDSVARRHLRTIDRTEPFIVAPWKGHHMVKGENIRFNPNRGFRALADRCGAPWLSPHDMRHTFAALHAQAGTSIYKIARWLGDSVKVTVKHYAALSPDDADIDNTI